MGERAREPEDDRSNVQRVAPALARLRILFVNVYFAGDPAERGAPWVLVDAGLPHSAARIVEAAEARFGRGSRPAAIVLTHGHFDHVGALETLVKRWNVPVYAHALELPYLTGASDYAPPDPSVDGGAMARLSFLYPRRPINLGERVQPLPAGGVVPEMPGWRWIYTPGHAPGHVSLFREEDRTLIAGDAFVTVKQESALAVLRQKQEIHGPPAYFTPDWQAARASVEHLTRLQPSVAATGHGVPMAGEALRRGLEALAHDFERLAVPARGRYVHQPARADVRGVVAVPPPVSSERYGWTAFGAALAATAAVGLGLAFQVARHRQGRMAKPVQVGHSRKG